MKATAYPAAGRQEPSLYSATGARKYINAEERQRFLQAADKQDAATRALCRVLTFTGCRLSEALALTPISLQPSMKVIAIRSLKKRGRIAVREVPVSLTFIEELLTFAQNAGAHDENAPLWTWQRTWAWMRVKDVMKEAGIVGLHASPKGLRHGFGVHAVHCGVQLNFVQKWLGHANIATTTIYTDAVGPEEHDIAGKVWGRNIHCPVCHTSLKQGIERQQLCVLADAILSALASGQKVTADPSVCKD